MNTFKIAGLFFLLIINCAKKENFPLTNGHAHNDYLHKNPLLDAVENGFISVEVDVHFLDNKFYVSHYKPKTPDTTKTLEKLYLKPLLNIINKNKGKVYNDYDGFFYLMIDVKTDAKLFYEKLKAELIKYESIISNNTKDTEEKNKPVKIVVTGFKGRPFHQILKEKSSLMSIDGRFKELNKNVSHQIMPYISENYNSHFSYKGVGEPSLKDQKKISNMVNKTHKEGKKLRFWASPDNKAVWSFLINNKVDLVNIDSLVKFKKYISY